MIWAFACGGATSRGVAGGRCGTRGDPLLTLEALATFIEYVFESKVTVRPEGPRRVAREKLADGDVSSGQLAAEGVEQPEAAGSHGTHDRSCQGQVSKQIVTGRPRGSGSAEVQACTSPSEAEQVP